MASKDFQRQLAGYGLTTAQILYRMPDHPSLLQTYVWQDYDLCPKFPALNKFLAFWLEKLEGPLHSVTVAHSRLIKPAENSRDQRRVPAALRHDPEKLQTFRIKVMRQALRANGDSTLSHFARVSRGGMS